VLSAGKTNVLSAGETSLACNGGFGFGDALVGWTVIIDGDYADGCCRVQLYEWRNSRKTGGEETKTKKHWKNFHKTRGGLAHISGPVRSRG
jgi:hypothetical protein